MSAQPAQALPLTAEHLDILRAASDRVMAGAQVPGSNFGGDLATIVVNLNKVLDQARMALNLQSELDTTRKLLRGFVEKNPCVRGSQTYYDGQAYLATIDRPEDE